MKKSELRQIIKEEIDKVLNQKWQIIFYDDYTDTPVKQLFDSKQEAERWADSVEYDYQDIIINDRGDDEWKTFYKFHNPEDKETYNGYDVKSVENLSESQNFNPVNKFFRELANEGEELVKKMKERNGNL
jgi:hypothetical protein